jgi:acetate kinase
MQDVPGRGRVAAIGHRIVHGGPRYWSPEIITPEVVAELKRLMPFDPQHLPAQIALIEALNQQFPGILQLACFDTAFHHDLPLVSRRIAIPRKYEAAGVRRYGFHGLSFSSVMDQLRALGEDEWKGNIVLAHLGNGSSLAALRDGRCVDTSMCLTPAGGIPMGTRSGDIDPGLPDYLSRGTGMTPEAFNHMVNLESGLLGISETTADMQQLLDLQATDHRAAEAIEHFCYQVTKCIGAFAAALGGLGLLVFSGGIGENAPAIRRLVCERLGFSGIHLNEEQNQKNAGVISTGEGCCRVRIISADEEQVIADTVERYIATRRS